MKTLLIMRHAEAREPGMESDRQRSLSARGVEQAERMGAFLLAEELPPAYILCSNSRRTIDTSRTVIRELNQPARIYHTGEIYEGGFQRYLEQVRRVPGEAAIALLVGHSPTVTPFTQKLCIDGVSVDAFPPAAMACLQIDVDHWSAVDALTAHCRWFARPDGSSPSGVAVTRAALR